MKLITLTPEQKKITDHLDNERRPAQQAFEEVSAMILRAKEKFWDALKEMYPEIKDYDECSYFRTDGQILLLKSKTENESDDGI